MIRAGQKKEITWNSGSWIFLDVGFSNQRRTCGLLFDNQEPEKMRFNEAIEKIITHIRQIKRPVNLVIEAPLSVAFDSKGNPKGREIEKRNGKTRYWYAAPGCVVMVAALYVINGLCNVIQSQEIRLFEGFVSFRAKTNKTNHLKDVCCLKRAVKNPSTCRSQVVCGEQLKMNPSDRLLSAFMVAGHDYGVPPVIKCRCLTNRSSERAVTRR